MQKNRGRIKLVAREVFKVLYAPVKAFQEIVKNPSVKGPLLVLALTLLATIVLQSITASKQLLETSEGQVSLLATDAFGFIISYSLIAATFVFFFNWVIYAAFVLLFLVVSRGRLGSLTRFFLVIGHIFVVTTVYVLVNAFLFIVLPVVSLPLQTWPPQTEEQIEAVTQIFREKWYSNVAFQLGYYLDLAFSAWTAVVCAVAIRFFSQLTWRRAAIISAIASIISLFFRFSPVLV